MVAKDVNKDICLHGLHIPWLAVHQKFADVTTRNREVTTHNVKGSNIKTGGKSELEFTEIKMLKEKKKVLLPNSLDRNEH